jgi:hypothetical protein
MYIFIKNFSRQIYSYSFHISKLNNLKVLHDLYSQCLTQGLSKMTSFFNTEGVCNIQIKHLQHTCETAETFETYTCNIHV